MRNNLGKTANSWRVVTLCDALKYTLLMGSWFCLKKKKVVQTTKPKPSLERFSGPLYTMISLARLCETLKFDWNKCSCLKPSLRKFKFSIYYLFTSLQWELALVFSSRKISGDRNSLLAFVREMKWNTSESSLRINVIFFTTHWLDQF